MNRRILSAMLIVLMSLVLIQVPAEASGLASVEAAYSDGVVTVNAEYFMMGEAYIIRVVNKTEKYVKAMGQTEADENGKLSASVTTGELEKLSDYTVYLNNMNGILIAENDTILNSSMRASIDAYYDEGVIEVTGEAFIPNNDYVIRVVNKTENYVAAMTQIAADGDGKISVSVTTGVLGNLSDYIVYVNSMDGLMAASDDTIRGDSSFSFKVVYDGNGNTSGFVPVDGQSYKENETVTVLGNANNLKKTGYSFSGWTRTSDGSGTVYAEGSTLNMGSSNITLYAKWAVSSSPGGGGTGTEPEKSGAPTVEKNGDISTVTLAITAEYNNSGKSTVTITDKNIEDILTYVRDAQSKGQNVVIKIRVESEPQTRHAEVVLKGDAFNKLVNEIDADIILETELGSMTINAQTQKVIAGMSEKDDIIVEIKRLEAAEISKDVLDAVGDRPVYDISIAVGDRTVSESYNVSIGMSIPYTLRPGEAENAIIANFVDDYGNVQLMRGAYSNQEKTVNFVINHFSKYAISYNEVSFTDVFSDAWYYDAVTFIAARNITSGTGEGRYSPEWTLTRGQFIVMLMRAYGIEPDEISSGNFDDAGDTYYTGYLSAAKKLKIANGVGGNNFSPESNISRQEMFTLLYRSLMLIDELPDDEYTRTLADFTDAAEVASWAKDPMEYLVRSGKISGNNNNINPLDTATRVEMAQIIYNLLSN